jgi:hypothetical protein
MPSANAGGYRVRSLLILILALAGCGKAPQAPAAEANGSAGAAASAFPQAGEYDIVRDSAGRREESRMRLDVSDPQAFEALVAGGDGSNCRDRQFSMSGGSFNARITCDAPDGDIHNIVIQRMGHYTATSIDITTDTFLWGRPFRETAMYRLRRAK